MSELRADTITASDGTSPVTLTKQSAAKAWANFNGSGTLATRDTFNASSVADDGVGLYSVDFISNMSDGNYAAPGCATYFGNDSATALVYAMRTSSNVYTEHASNGFALRISDNNSDGALDSGSVELAVMGDLA